MKRGWLLPIVSGILFALSYPPYNLEFLAWVGFIPLFLLIFNGESKNFTPGFITGFTYFLIVMKWFWSVYPLAWAGVENNFISLILIGLIWIISAAGMALWWGLAFVIFNFNKNPKTSYLFLGFPSVFVITEYLRSWFFGFLWAGPETLWGPHWTMGNLAYIFHNNSLFLKLSSFMGIYGITFLIVLANIFILNLSKSKIIPLKKASLVILLILIFTFSSKLLSDEPIERRGIPTQVAVVQTKTESNIIFSIEKQLEEFKQQLNLLKEAAKLNPRPKVIIFPEGTNFFKSLSIFLNTDEVKKFFDGNFPEPTLIVDNSRIIDEKGNIKSRVIYLDSKRGAIGFYDKQFLTPGGEFLPYAPNFIIKLFSKQSLTTFSSLREFTKGEKNSQIVSLEDLKTGVLVCSGLLSPGLFKKLSSQNPDFTIAMASTGIFKGANDIIKQDLAMAKFRASENNKYLVLAANYGNSAIIDNNGRVLKTTKSFEPQLFTGEVISRKTRSWYNKLGDIPILTLSFITILGTITTKRRKI